MARDAARRGDAVALLKLLAGDLSALDVLDQALDDAIDNDHVECVRLIVAVHALKEKTQRSCP